MVVLVINSGSSSLKYQLYQMETRQVLAKGVCERIGIDGVLKHSVPGRDPLVLSTRMEGHKEALQTALRQLTSKEHGVISNLKEIDAVGHRVGHGGERLKAPCLITQEVKDIVTDCIPLGRLHLPPALMGFAACEEVLPGVPQVAVFDTEFHAAIPRKAHTYSLPKRLREKHGIRKYGFHGMSHKYVSEQAAAYMGKEAGEVNLITCHLGNGSSVTAVEKGVSVDTSMGFTALEGLVMGTRCGDMDPGVCTFVMREENLTPYEMEMLLYKESGILGLSGLSPDLRDVEEAAARGNEDARLAIEVLCYQVKKYIGAYMAVLGRVDAVVFTGGIGENSDVVRGEALAGLEPLGIRLDGEKNRTCRGKLEAISLPESEIQVLVVPTNEEWVIARDTMRVITGEASA